MNDLESILKEQGIEYVIIQHEHSIQSARDGAEYLGIDIGQTAPTLILKSEKEYYAIILSGNHGRIDFEIPKQILGCRELKLAKPKEVEQVTGSKVGTVALIGHHLPTILDRQLKQYPHIYGGTGFANSTLKISPGDVEKLNHIIAYIR
ncbi:hypothetical protein J2TS4_10130 [Paenibacillus sp. J2TS4]|nr:hypothetical protein J2TS4_10130 [Paenibacillus sp. J2TS4]